MLSFLQNTYHFAQSLYISFDEAMEQGNIALILYYLSKGESIERPCFGMTPLHMAIRSNQVELALKLVALGANIEALYAGETPLNHAIRRKRGEIALYLINNGANIEALAEGKTPLHHAINHHLTEVAISLINHHANIEAIGDDQTPLQCAIGNKATEVALHLINNKGANIHANFRGYSTLHRAIEWGEAEVTKQLIDKGADIQGFSKGIGSRGLSPLHIAIRNKLTSIALYLIDKGADIEARSAGKHPLHSSMPLGGSELPSYNLTPLHLAIQNEQYEVAKALVDKGADINAKILVNDKETDTVIHCLLNVSGLTMMDNAIFDLFGSSEFIVLLEKILLRSPNLALTDAAGISCLAAIKQFSHSNETLERLRATKAALILSAMHLLDELPVEIVYELVQFALPTLTPPPVRQANARHIENLAMKFYKKMNTGNASLTEKTQSAEEAHFTESIPTNISPPLLRRSERLLKRALSEDTIDSSNKRQRLG